MTTPDDYNERLGRIPLRDITAAEVLALLKRLHDEERVADRLARETDTAGKTDMSNYHQGKSQAFADASVRILRLARAK